MTVKSDRDASLSCAAEAGRDTVAISEANDSTISDYCSKDMDGLLTAAVTDMDDLLTAAVTVRTQAGSRRHAAEVLGFDAMAWIFRMFRLHFPLLVLYS